MGSCVTVGMEVFTGSLVAVTALPGFFVGVFSTPGPAVGVFLVLEAIVGVSLTPGAAVAVACPVPLPGSPDTEGGRPASFCVLVPARSVAEIAPLAL
jgi:hypothetical protein